MQKLRDNIRASPESYKAKATLFGLDLQSGDNAALNLVVQLSMAAFTYAELNAMKKDIVGFLNKQEKVTKLSNVPKSSNKDGIYAFFTAKKTQINGGKPSAPSSSSYSFPSSEQPQKEFTFDTDTTIEDAPKD